MRYLRIINNEVHYPFSLQTLKIENPNTSFPDKIESIGLAEYGIYVVNDVTKPSNENYTKIVNEIEPILTNGQYYQNWLVEDATAEYTESMLQNDINSKWNQIRVIRNQYFLQFLQKTFEIINIYQIVIGLNYPIHHYLNKKNRNGVFIDKN